MEPLQPWQRYYVYPGRYLDAVHWSITGKCNFRCRHCLVSAPDACHPQLPLEDCLKIMDQIARCGIRQVDITGGEPLVRRDYEDFFKELSYRGIFIRTFSPTHPFSTMPFWMLWNGTVTGLSFS